MEESMRLEAEKERKRKGLPLSKVSKDYYNLTRKFNLFYCVNIFRVMNKSKKSAWINRPGNHHLRTLVRKVVRQSRSSNNRITMNQVVKRLLLIVIVCQIQAPKPFYWMIWQIDIENRQRVAQNVADREDQSVEIAVDSVEM